MKNLSDVVFTNRDDSVVSPDGIFNGAQTVVDSLAGNDFFIALDGSSESLRSWGFLNEGQIFTSSGDDAILGKTFIPLGQPNYGLLNNGVIDMGAGGDSIRGEVGNQGGSFGYGLFNRGSILLGNGNDFVVGRLLADMAENSYAIINIPDALIDTGTGNDLVLGQADVTTANHIGLLNYGTVRTGSGGDTIQATGLYAAIYNYGELEAGDGNDQMIASTYDQVGVNANGSITNIETLRMGAGADCIRAQGSRFGILNNGTIEMGTDSDSLFALGSFDNGAAVLNTGTIDTGTGNDTLDAITGGFDGGGYVTLGDGDDSCKGYGAGSFDAGRGQKDTLTLPSGTYEILDTGGGWYRIGGVMNVAGFEFFGLGADSNCFMVAAEIGRVTFA